MRESVLNNGIDVSRHKSGRKPRAPLDEQRDMRKRGLLARLFEKCLSRPTQALALACLCAVAASISVNALFLQSQRHPAPFFAKNLLAARLAQSAKEAKANKAAEAARQAIAAKRIEMAEAARQASDEAAAIGARHILQRRHISETAPDRAGRSTQSAGSNSGSANNDRAAGDGNKRRAAQGRDTASQPGPARDLIGSLIRNNGGALPRPPRDIPGQDSASSNHARTAATPAEKQRIVSMQRALVKLGYTLSVDGIAGPATKAALEKFQRKNRLPPSGRPGDKTLQVLASRARVEIP